jgi:hypothetical protein
MYKWLIARDVEPPRKQLVIISQRHNIVYNVCMFLETNVFTGMSRYLHANSTIGEWMEMVIYIWPSSKEAIGSSRAASVSLKQNDRPDLSSEWEPHNKKKQQLSEDKFHG